MYIYIYYTCIEEGSRKQQVPRTRSWLCPNNCGQVDSKEPPSTFENTADICPQPLCLERFQDKVNVFVSPPGLQRVAPHVGYQSGQGLNRHMSEPAARGHLDKTLRCTNKFVPHLCCQIDKPCNIHPADATRTGTIAITTTTIPEKGDTGDLSTATPFWLRPLLSLRRRRLEPEVR